MLEIQAIQKSASTTNGHVVSDPVFCVIPASKDLDTLAGLYKKELEAAAFKGAETIYFPSLLQLPAAFIPGHQPDLPYHP